MTTGALSRGAATAAWATVPCFAIICSLDVRADGPVTLLLVVAAGLGATFLTRLAGARRAWTPVAVLVALVVLWVAAQRLDPATAVVLAALLGAALGLMPAPAPTAGPVEAATASALAVVILGLRLAGSWEALLALAAALVLVAGAVALGQAPAPENRRAGPVRAAATLGLVVVVAGLYVAYLGASSPAMGWFGGGVVHGSRSGDEVAITFDDGPNPATTPAVAAILDRYGVKGTFFLVGKALDAEPAAAQSLLRQGHLLGGHSYHHDSWRWLDPRYPELDRTDAAFARRLDVCPAFYRPPHGQRTPFMRSVAGDHGQRLVLWDTSAGDWATDDADLVARRVLREVQPGSIILLHDGLDGDVTADRSVLVRALPKILDGLRAKGLKPVRLDQLVGGPAYRPCD